MHSIFNSKEYGAAVATTPNGRRSGEPVSHGANPNSGFRLDGEKLLAANCNPNLYPDLIVRVTGFTAYFLSLSPQFRQLVVDKFLKDI